METLDQETDSLASLEERIHQAVQLVNRLRHEKDTALAEKQAAVRKATEAQSQVALMSTELESLRSERKQVRARIEKLLGQIDQLNGV